MKRSDSIAALAAALAAAQGQIRNAAKDQANPFYHSKYADLAGIADACRKPLSENGLAVMQFPRALEGGIEVETVLAHSSGEWVSEILWLPATMISKDGKERFDAQSVGSAITYARRYALAAIVGVCPEDDDGNSATVANNNAKASLRERAFAILKPAADQGREAFAMAWKALSQTMREAAKPDMDRLKFATEQADAGKDGRAAAATLAELERMKNDATASA